MLRSRPGASALSYLLPNRTDFIDLSQWPPTVGSSAAGAQVCHLGGHFSGANRSRLRGAIAWVLPAVERSVG